MTREGAIEKHREMWNWIAETTKVTEKKVYKSDYLNAFGAELEYIPENMCFCVIM